MGRAVTAMLGIDGAVSEVRPGWWLALSGLPSADMNMALIHDPDEPALAQVMARVDEVGCPTLLMLAGGAAELADRLPAQWSAVGAMPIMTSHLTATAADPRVRQAGSDDTGVISRLMSEAFGIDPGEIQVIVSHVLRDPGRTMLWLLEDEGEPVSTVLTCRIEDTVSLWCMATPPQFARRGYGRALLGAVLGWAARDGATVGLLGATPAGEPLYRATGWTVAESWNLHLNARSAQFGD